MSAVITHYTHSCCLQLSTLLLIISVEKMGGHCPYVPRVGDVVLLNDTQRYQRSLCPPWHYGFDRNDPSRSSITNEETTYTHSYEYPHSKEYYLFARVLALVLESLVPLIVLCLYYPFKKKVRLRFQNTPVLPSSETCHNPLHVRCETETYILLFIAGLSWVVALCICLVLYDEVEQYLLPAQAQLYMCLLILGPPWCCVSCFLQSE